MIIDPPQRHGALADRLRLAAARDGTVLSRPLPPVPETDDDATVAVRTPPLARLRRAWIGAEDAVDAFLDRRLASPRLAGLGRRTAVIARFFRRPPPMLFGAVAGVIALAVLVRVTDVGRRGDPAVRPPAPETRIRAPADEPPPLSVEAQIAARRLDDFADAVERSDDLVATLFEEPIRLSPPFDAIDSVVFDAELRRFRLWGVWPVARNEICRDEEGSRFACGLMARAALQNHIATRRLVCSRIFGAARETDFVEVSCSVEGEDLAVRMVKAGFAFPTLRSGRPEEEALAEAVAEKRGYWNGPQTAPISDRAAEDARSIPIGGMRLQTAPADVSVPFSAPTVGDATRVRLH